MFGLWLISIHYFVHKFLCKMQSLSFRPRATDLQLNIPLLVIWFNGNYRMFPLCKEIINCIFTNQSLYIVSKSLRSNVRFVHKLRLCHFWQSGCFKNENYKFSVNKIETAQNKKILIIHILIFLWNLLYSCVTETIEILKSWVKQYGLLEAG